MWPPALRAAVARTIPWGGQDAPEISSGLTQNADTLGVALGRPARRERSEIAFASFHGKAAWITLPDDPRMLQHVYAIGMREREGHVLLAE
jgi:hypothetical protein